jgi:hypothetical protein
MMLVKNGSRRVRFNEPWAGAGATREEAACESAA